MLWTADTLRSTEFAYLTDAVARARAAADTLDVATVEAAASWTVKDAALSLGVSEQSVTAAISSGDLPAVRKRGQLYLDPRAVETYVTTRAAGRSPRVPALFARVGSCGGAVLRVQVRDSEGNRGAGNLTSSRDGIDELVWPAWAEAVVLWGTEGALRAARLRPTHGVRTAAITLGELEVRGRWSIVERTDEHGAALGMLAGC